MEPKLRGNYLVFALIGLILCGCVVIFVLQGKISRENPKASQSPLPSSSALTQPIPNNALIAWDPILGTKPIKVTEQLAFYKDPLFVFKIATFQSGEYKDKILSLAVSQIDYKNWNQKEGWAIPRYIYFVSDEKGNPLAWNDSFFHDYDTRCFGPDRVEGCEWVYAVKDVLGLKPNLIRQLDFLPQELNTSKILALRGSAAQFSLAPYEDRLISPDTSYLGAARIAETLNGFPLIKTQQDVTFNFQSATARYFLLLPFGSSIAFNATPDFVEQNGLPKLTWTLGTKGVQVYRYGEYAYGWQDCYESLPQGKLEASLIETGRTVKGASVYEVNPIGHDQVYQCLHEKTRRYNYDPATGLGVYVDTVSYADFINSHPVFFWKHQYGEWIAFIREDVVPAAEKAKPVIYLYPEKAERVSVKVAPLGGFTETIPAYENGWIVDANPEGKIVDTKDGKTYPYLFWEGGKEGIVNTPKEGFVAAKADIGKVLDEKLSQFNLNAKERADFLEFWVPKLSQAPYYFLTFISESEINRVAPLSISPRPDTVIRVLLDYKPLNEKVAVKPLLIKSKGRSGFTVVEWGGIVR